MGKMIIPNTKEMDEIKSESLPKWSLIKNLSDFIKTLDLEDKNLWAPLDKRISSDLAKHSTSDYSSWKLLAFNNLEGKRKKKEIIEKTNNLIKDFQEKELYWETIKGQDEIIFGTRREVEQDPKYLKSLVKEIMEDLKNNYPIIVVQERKDEYLWGFYYNPKNWRRYDISTGAKDYEKDYEKDYNTIIKFAIPLQTTEKHKESAIYIMGIPITNGFSGIEKGFGATTDYYGGFYPTQVIGKESSIMNPIKIYGVYPKTGFVNWNISPFEIK